MAIQTLSPDGDAKWFAMKMLASDRTMRAILDETVTSGENGQMTESGRTACGGLSDMAGPLSRFPRAVDLAECPRDLAGTYHTHVTTNQLLNPTHSLPDMANVAFRGLDVSVIVGAETADVLVVAEDREEMAESFRNVLGIDARNTSDVVSAIDDGRIRDPARARQRLRREFSSLFESHPTGYDGLRERIRRLDSTGAITTLAPTDAGGSVEPMYAMAYLAGAHDGEHEWGYGQSSHTRRVRGRARRINANAPAMASSIAGTVLNTATGLATRRAIKSMFSPRR